MSSRKDKGLSGWDYVLIAFVGLIIGVGLLVFGIYNKQHIVSWGLVGNFFYVIHLILGIVTGLFLFGVIKSYAFFTHTTPSHTLQLGGPAAIVFLVVVGGSFLLKPDPPRKVSLMVTLKPVTEISGVDYTKGKIILIIDGRKSTLPIDAYKQGKIELSGDDVTKKAKIEVIDIESVELLHPDKEYLLNVDNIEVEIRKKLRTFSARVIDKAGHPVADASVYISPTQSTKSDSDGIFKIQLESDQSSFRLTVDKKGAGSFDEYVYFDQQQGKDIQLHLKK